VTAARSGPPRRPKAHATSPAPPPRPQHSGGPAATRWRGRPPPSPDALFGRRIARRHPWAPPSEDYPPATSWRGEGIDQGPVMAHQDADTPEATHGLDQSGPGVGIEIAPAPQEGQGSAAQRTTPRRAHAVRWTCPRHWGRRWRSNRRQDEGERRAAPRARPRRRWRRGDAETTKTQDLPSSMQVMETKGLR